MAHESGCINNKVFYRTVAALVIPMALQNLINVAVQSADVIMLGRVSEVALSASSLAGQIQFVMTLFFFGLSSGATVLTAQYWGKGEVRTIEKVMAITLRLSVGVAALFMLAALFIPGTLMRIFSPDPVIIENGVKYLRWVAPSYLFMGFSNIYLNVMRSVEKVVVSTAVYFVSFVANVVLNAVLIFGLLGAPALGIVGAAVATTLARLLELVIVLVYAAHNQVLRLHKADFFSRHKTLLRTFMRYSLPTILNELFWGMAISANSVIIGHMGAAAVAANSVAQVMRQLATVVCFGIANAAAIMIGKAIGADENGKARGYATRFIKLTLVAGFAGSLIILGLRPFIVLLMNLSPEADNYLRFLLLWMSVYVMAQAVNTTMVVGIFRGGGDTRFGLIMDTAVMWGGSILWGALAAFVFRLPVPVVYMIIMCDEFIKLPLVTLRYKSGRWLRNVTH